MKTKKDLDPEVYEFYKAALDGPGFEAPFSVDDVGWLREDEVKRHAAHTDPYEVYEVFDKFIQRPAPQIKGKSVSGKSAEDTGRLAEAEDPLMVRVYIPESVHDRMAAKKTRSGGAPVILYFHGGGYIMGCVDDHDPLCGKLADACEAVVISVEYRLAPEYPFPACIDDAVLAADWAHENAGKFGGDPGRLMAGGDSSGANISAVLALLGKAGKAPELSRLILFYGVYGCVDLAESESAKEFGQGGFVLPVSAMNEMMKIYLPDDADPGDMRIAPGLAEDLAGMPPSIIVSAEFDPLRDDSREFARRLQEAGNEVEYIEMDGMMHGFILYYQRFHRAEELIDRIGSMIRNEALEKEV